MEGGRDLSQVTAFVMAAGFGKRLLPLTALTPKPLLPFQGRPLIDHVLRALGDLGVSKIIINTHYLADQLHQHIRSHFPHVKVSYEDPILETAGGIKQALPLMDQGEDLLIINPDVWWGQGWSPVIQKVWGAWQCVPGAEALLGLVPIQFTHGYEGRGDYCGVSLEGSDPGPLFWGKGEPAPFVYGSLCMMKQHLFEEMSETYLSNKTLWDRCEERKTLRGTVLRDSWWDLGTLETYKSAQKFWER